MGPLGRIFLFAIVAGTALAAWILFPALRLKLGSLRQNASPQATSTSPIQEKTTQPFLLLKNDQSVTLVTREGAVERLTFDEFSKRYSADRQPKAGALVANGAPTKLSFAPPAKLGTPIVLTSPDEKYTATLGTRATDGASSINLQRGNEKTRALVLRYASAPIREASLFAWADERTMLVGAMATSSRAIFSVQTNGSVRLIASLPESTLWIEGNGLAVWYATAEPGEGIESDPLPPSELHRVTANGDVLIWRATDAVILRFVSGEDRVAFVTSDGQAYEKKDAESVLTKLGTHQPLLFLDDQTLLVRDGFDLLTFDLKTSSVKRITEVPEGSVEAYLMLPALDERMTKP